MFEKKLFTTTEAKRINEKRILSVSNPEYTKTYSPYSHRMVKEATELALRELGFFVQEKLYSCSNDGANVVSLWRLNAERSSGNICIAWRNSLNKFWSVGYCEALMPSFNRYVLSFGKFANIRRHTGQLTAEGLQHMVKNTVHKSLEKIDSFIAWEKELKNIYFDESTAERLVALAMRDKALLPKNFKDFDHSFFTNPIFNLYNFYYKLIHMIKDDHLQRLMEYSIRITRFIDKAKLIVNK